MSSVVTSFKAARRCGTPIVAVSTPDQFATMAELKDALSKKTPAIVWDIASGLRALNEAGGQVISGDVEGEPAFLQNPAEALSKLRDVRADTVVFMMTANRVLGEPVVMQALLNIRDPFKVNGRTVVLLGPGFTFPAEIEGDVIELDEKLPTRDALEVIVRAQYDNAREVSKEVPAPTKDVIEKSVDALLGLAAFTAEQVTAMSLTKQGIDLPALWDRKRQSIERTPGLAVWKGGETFDDVGGFDNIKTFLLDVIAGEEPPRAIVFIDEIEKALAGAGTDTSGTTTNQLGQLLSFMQDTEADGVMFIGHPGTSKSLIAKAAGNAAKVPTIALDLGGMKDSLVGQSEARTRAALKVVEAVSQGRALFVATCNGVASLPPELRRRFTFGEYFFDLPTEEERKAIWSIYFAKYKLDPRQPLPDDKGWTGAEIKNCARLAWKLRRPLVEAGKRIVPISRSAPQRVKSLQEEAHNRYNSASYEGTYNKDKAATSALPTTAGRRTVQVG